ncbi:urease accessory UreF family protein [Haloarculaceae archaeon H-GB2-1]|nr:urease accessory UreF family protein [Haloarculaceae archaeon H-GB1-1]MEA5388650.1 urease accessory UreF family protein [Haloarculaceae archaeon H-GB11]MEA5406704.1 urease accessory UreF family protein [Haloarculaceae archaeon H-GB2-1]
MTDEAALASFRLADSFLPVGTYSVSYGLEQFVQSGRVEDAADLTALLETYLRRQLETASLVALRAAHDAAAGDDLDAVCEADRRLLAVTLAAEFRADATRAGDRLLTLQRDLETDPFLEAYADRVADDTAPGTHSAVLGAVAARAGVSERRACLVCCHGFVTDLLGAAQRLLAFGHTDAQRVLTDLQPVIVDAVEGSADCSLDDLIAFTPLVDLVSAEHERADRRLFSS